MMGLILALCLWSSCYLKTVDLTLQLGNLHFTSLNFKALLQWDPVSEKSAVYYVQYKVYGEPWENKTDCYGIQQNWCNMTSEMSSPEHQCEMNFARVKVTAGNYSSPWKNSGSFHPFHDSTIGPPTVTLSHSFNSITVNMSLPQTIVHSKCLTERNKKKIQFIITVSHLAEVPETYYTKEKVWNISNLSPGSTHCISVEIELWHKNKRSMASPTHCVNLEKKTAKEIIIGLLAAAMVIVMAFSIIIIYLTLYKFLLHPKAHLPSNLVLKGTDSHSNEREWEENGFVPLTFEDTELTRYILETKESNMESPQYKRYVSNEPRIKKYVNCRQKAENLHDVLQSKTVELVNPTYTTKMFKSCHIQEEHTCLFC